MPRLLLCALLALSPPPGEQAEAAAWHRLVGLLQYLQGDYARAVALNDAAELEEQRGLAEEAVAATSSLGDPAAGYRLQVESIRDRIKAGSEPQAVSSECGALAARILEEQKLERAPRRSPDLRRGAEVWTANCAPCHGATGDAKTPLAATLTPRPFDFRDAERMAALTPYRAFNTTRLGVKGTAMPAFPQLSEADRWAVAFYVFTLRQPACEHPPPAAPLQVLAQSTDGALAKGFGPEQVACLRRRLSDERPASGPLFDSTREGLAAARALYRSGKHPAARMAVVDAYLLGIEPIEPMLRARSPELIQQLEQAFTRTRVAADQGVRFEEEAAALLALLDRAERTGSRPGDFWSVFIAAMLIVLREGFEALVVVGALLAVLKKLNATAQARVIYAAVAAALALGVLGLAFAHQLLAGANREWMETIVAFFAVAMLLYAALWLNRRSTMSAFMTQLRGQVTQALGSGSNLGLFTVAFVAVARESFETALFIEGLAGDSARGALWGAAAGLAGLAVLVVIIRKVGFVLPMKTLFRASTALLLATAVMVLGKGLHGLQEVGVLTLRPIPFFELDALGIFPDAITLLPQLLLGAAAGWWWWRSTSAATSQSR